MKEIKVRIDLPTIDRLKSMIPRGGNGIRVGLGRLVWEAVEFYLDRWGGPKRRRPPLPKAGETDGRIRGRSLAVKMAPLDLIQLKDLARKLSKPAGRRIRAEQLVLQAARTYAFDRGVTQDERRLARESVSGALLSEAYHRGLREMGMRCRFCGK